MHPLGICLRQRQRTTVELAADQPWQGGQDQRMGRQHVVRQVFACLLADAPDQGLRAGTLLAHHIGHQLLACTGILDQHGGLDHAGHGPDRLLDLAQLDAEAPDLDLVVGPAYVLDVAVRHLAHQVPRAVQAAATAVEGVGDEALGRQAVARQIAPRQAIAADVQLAHDAVRHPVQVGVQDVHRALSHGPADGGVGAVEGLAGLGLPDQRRHHRLGGAVAVDQQARAQALAHLVVGGLGHGLATEDIQLHRRRLLRMLCGPVRDLRQIGRRERGIGDAVVAQGLAGLLRRPHLRLAQHQACTDAQGRQPALMRAVEGEGHEMQLARVRPHAVDPGRGRAVHGQRPVLDHDPLGLPGRARGVDHIGQVALMHGRGRRRVAGLGEVHLFGHHQMGHGRRAQPVQRRPVGDQVGGAAVCQHEPLAFGGRRRVQGQVGRARLEHGQQADHHFQRTLHGDADDGSWPHAGLHQTVGEMVAARLQLAMADGLLAHDQRHRAGVPARLPLHAGMHGQEWRTAGIPAGAGQRIAARLGQQGDVPQAVHALARHGLQHLHQLPQQGLHGVIAEAASVVDHLERQHIAQPHLQIHGIGGHVDGMRHRKPQMRVVMRGQHGIHGVVLEHQDAIEQAALALARPALDIRKRGLLMLARGQVLCLQRAQPGAQLQRPVAGHDHRQGVDEQPLHSFHAGQLGRAASHRGPEGHRGLARVPRQHQRPCGLHQGVGRHALALGKLHQLLRGTGLQRGTGLVVPLPGCRQGTRPDSRPGKRIHQQGGLVQRLHQAPPVGLAGPVVQALQPCDVVAVAGVHGLHGNALVVAQHLAQQAR